MLRCRGHQLYPGRVSESVWEASAAAAVTASTAAVVAALVFGIGCPKSCLMLVSSSYVTTELLPNACSNISHNTPAK